MYGSIFGFEEILHAIWLKPMKAMMDVPLVGRLNAVFVIAIGFGMLLILICMVFNIINAVRNHDTERTWFDSNAVAGLVFYGSIALSAVLLVSGKKASRSSCSGSYVRRTADSDVPEGASYQSGREKGNRSFLNKGDVLCSELL